MPAAYMMKQVADNKSAGGVHHTDVQGRGALHQNPLRTVVVTKECNFRAWIDL